MGPEDLAREAELLSYEVLDRPPLPALRELVRSAARVFGAQMAEVNAVTVGETVHLARSDGHESRVPRADSFCGTAVQLPERTWVVPDARDEPRVSRSPYVAGPLAGIRFYAGTQLRSEAGIVLGTLCVWDETARTFTEEEERQLELLGEAAVSILDLHRSNVRLAGTLRRLAASHRAIGRSNASLEAFAGQVSHDLQSPLTSVRLGLEMLRDTSVVRDDADAAFLVERALAGAGRMHRTIVDLMDFAVLGGDDVREQVELEVLVREVLEDLHGLVGAARITVGELPRVAANAGQVRAVVQNLLTNALKFAAAPGPPAISVAGEVRAGVARVTITDNGPGIGSEDRETIFGLLVRGGAQDVEGHGIGLATCARIVAAHGGRIGVEEAPGGGACFWFELEAA